MTDLVARISPWRTERTEWLRAELELIGARLRVTDDPIITALADGDPFELPQRADGMHRLCRHQRGALATHRPANRLTEIR